MVVLALICVATGVALAQRFKFMILAPAAAFVLGGAAYLGLWHANPFACATTVIAGMQVGYFIGLGVRCLAEPTLSETSGAFRTAASSVRHPTS